MAFPPHPPPLPAHVTPDWLAALPFPAPYTDPDGPPPECLFRILRPLLGMVPHPTWHDAPAWMSPAIAALIDRMQFAREEWFRALALMLPTLIDTRGDTALEARRFQRLYAWAMHEAIPRGIEGQHPELARACREVGDLATWGPDALSAARRIARETDYVIDANPTSVEHALCTCTCNGPAHFTFFAAEDILLGTALAMPDVDPLPVLAELLAMSSAG